MKVLLSLIPFLFLFSFSTQAQTKYPKHSLKFGFGNSSFQSIDFQGKTRYAEYNRQLFNRFSIGMDGNWTNATNLKEEGLQKGMNRLTGNAHLFFAPIQKQNASFKIGVGPSFYTSKYDFENTNSETNPALPSPYSTKDHGFSIAADFEIFVIKSWTLGTRVTYQKYKNENQAFFWGFNTGLRF